MLSRLPVKFSYFGSAIMLMIAAAAAQAQEPLHQRIDQLIEANLIGPSAVLANDAEFLRRCSLDLNGSIPSAADARAFLDDPNPNKREVLVNRLLASARYPVHMADVFDVMFMERRPDKHVPTPEWQKYLQTSFEQNKPYDQLAREILGADGTDPVLRPAAKFILDRDAEPHSVGRDVGRIFFGMDLQCAQCHDHPLVDHYLQADYYGLHAFVNRIVVYTDAAQKKSFLGEKSDGDAAFKSVFTGDAAQTRPQLPGSDEIEEPRFHQGEDYITAPAANVRPVPKYSRHSKLAELATNGTNRQFNVNITNRLWALLMGRGLVHPVDLHHPMNPPTHPAVLELVTAEFIAHKYDMKWLLRELALTKTYQRSMDPPVDPAPQIAAAAQLVPQVEAELARLKALAEESRKQVDAAKDELKAARAVLEPVDAAWKKLEAAVTEAKKPVDAAAAAITKAQAESTVKQSAITAINEAAAKSADAAKLLPNDKEIAGVVATYTAKQQQLAAELAAIQKTIADQTAAQQAAQVKLAESYIPADAAYAAYVESRKPVDASKARFQAIWNQHKSDALAAAIQKRRLDGLQLHSTFGIAVASAAAAQAAIEPAKAEVAAANQLVQQQQAEINKQTAALSEIEKSAADASKLLDDAKAQFADKQGVVQTLAEAASKTDAALQKLAGDAELTLVSQKLKERREPLAKEVVTLEQLVSTRDAAAKDLATRMTAMKQSLANATTEMTVRQQAVTTKTNAVNQAISNAQTSQAAVASTRLQLNDQWTIAAGIRPLKQLSPEQLGWTVMQATGVLEPQRPGTDAEIEKTIPKAGTADDPVKSLAREVQLEELLHEKNRGNLNVFVSMYGQSAGQPQDDFFATPDQALFVGNGGSVIGWAAGGQLAQRLIPVEDPKALADELYLNILTRRPNELESAEVTQQLAARPTEKGVVVRDLIWALVTTAEFRFNH